MDKEYVERWEACKDCIHFDVCAIVRKNGEDRVLKNSPCKYFKNKADVAEVRHGYWIEKRWTTEGDWYNHHHRSITCSVCNKETYEGKETPYCPDCGAKMDGKSES